MTKLECDEIDRLIARRVQLLRRVATLTREERDLIYRVMDAAPLLTFERALDRLDASGM